MHRDMKQDQKPGTTEVIHKDGVSSKAFAKYFNPLDHPIHYLHLNGSAGEFQKTKDSPETREDFLRAVNHKAIELLYSTYYPSFIKYFGM